MRIIGIDPGTAICGYGIIDVKGSKLTPVAYGAITTPKELTDSQRLEILFNDLSDILEEFKPDKFGVEELFFNRNVTTAIKVGQARGVILLAAEQQRIPIYEYTPLQIKQAVTGYGKADKNQVIYMTMNILGIREKIKPDDTADATHLFKESCYVDVHGVGYRVYVPTTTRQQLIEGHEATLFTYLNVREDAMQLYGFWTEEEYELFILLISVSGIGPKVGLGILSGMTPEAFKLAVINGQVQQLTKLPGIGKKSAERLVLELKDKLAKMTHISAESPAAIQPIGVAASGATGEAIEALVSLGYSERDVADIVESLDDGKRDVSELIKVSLIELGKGR